MQKNNPKKTMSMFCKQKRLDYEVTNQNTFF
jgi:hypothetical protein